MMADNDGFTVQQEPTKSKKRIYIGNLKYSDDLLVKLVEFLKAAGLNVVETDVTIQGGGSSCFALVSCPNIGRAIASLNSVPFDGRQLVVQREKKAKRPTNRAGSKQSFGSSWSKPPTERKVPPPKDALDQVQKTSNNENLKDVWDVSDHVGAIVADEIEAAEQDPSNGDAMNVVIASSAAMTLLTSVNAFGLEEAEEKDTTVSFDEAEQDQTTPSQNVEEDFHAQSKKPLSLLLADYGEQDVNFKVKASKNFSSDSTEETKKSREDYHNRLTLQGKAPIHVELTSFGYSHGAPPELRTGWSHAHPLPSFDCRDLPQVPHYMARQDGLSPAVKRTLLNVRDQHNNSTVRQYANDLGKDIYKALEEAIISGGHGHAAPLRMTVYAGSESGRHRSVVLCELAATALRKLLRSNENNQITQPVSVGTRHRDIERRQREMERSNKQTNSESDW